MPTFYARRIRIFLSASNLAADAETTDVTRRGGPASTSVLEEVGPGLVRRSNILSEQTYPAEDGLSLRFIGAAKETPFYMVRAGEELFHRLDGESSGSNGGSESSHTLSAEQPDGTDHDDSMDGASSTAANKGSVSGVQETDPDSVRPSIEAPAAPRSGDPIPRADELLVRDSSTSTLSDRPLARSEPDRQERPAFVLGPPERPVWRRSTGCQPVLSRCPLTLTVALSRDSWRESSGRGPNRKDILIAVFFNGEFAASRVVSGSALIGTPEPSNFNQTFSGRRIGRTTERRWIVVPAGQNADGTPRWSRPTRAASMGAKKRWASIGEALEQEADRWGRTDAGERSVIGQYLADVAQIPMPDEIEELQKPGGQQFGVMDVVVVLGRGRKHPPNVPYLLEPRRSLGPIDVDGDGSSTRKGGSRPSTQEDQLKHKPSTSVAKESLRVGEGQPSPMGAPPKAPGASESRAKLKPALKPALKPRPRNNRNAHEDNFPSVLTHAAATAGTELGNAFSLQLVPAGGSVPAWSGSMNMAIRPAQDPPARPITTAAAREGQMLRPLAMRPGGNDLSRSTGSAATPASRRADLGGSGGGGGGGDGGDGDGFRTPKRSRLDDEHHHHQQHAVPGGAMAPAGPASGEGPAGMARKQSSGNTTCAAPARPDELLLPLLQPAQEAAGTVANPRSFIGPNHQQHDHHLSTTTKNKIRNGSMRDSMAAHHEPSSSPSPSPSPWTPSSLCEDSFIAYADTHAGLDGRDPMAMPLPMSMYQSCRCERPGVFDGHEVLMSVRFIVG